MARGATIIGLTKLQRKLDRLPKATKEQIRKAMESEANKIVALMKELVPVESGALRDSIGWTWGAAPKGATLVATVKGAGVGGDLTLTVYAGSEAVYWARYVEFGTSSRVNAGKFAGTRHPGTKARPFFYVSWRASRKEARKGVRKAVRTAARAVAAGG